MRILLVEDDRGVAGFVKKGMEAERYEVEVAADGALAMRLLDERRYALVILDLMLPDISGMEVCRHARSGGVQTPILMLTARDSVEDRVAGLAAGADDYMTKPFVFQELLARAAALLGRPPPGSGCSVRPIEEPVAAHPLRPASLRRRPTRGDRRTRCRTFIGHGSPVQTR